MSPSRRLVWILGWSIAPARFAALVEGVFPADRHVFIEPAPGWAEAVAAAGPGDWTVGYSLGSLLLAASAVADAQSPTGTPLPLGRVALLAPIWSFVAEAGAGGRISRAALRSLRRAVGQDPQRGVRHFAESAGLTDLVEPSSAEPSALLWGLGQLADCSVTPALPPRWIAFAGSEDPLLDAAALQRLVPALAIVPGAGHHPEPLLRELRRRMDPEELR